jgi:hypothetical protein
MKKMVYIYIYIDERNKDKNYPDASFSKKYTIENNFFFKKKVILFCKLLLNGYKIVKINYLINTY